MEQEKIKEWNEILKDLNIYEKMALITDEIGVVQKNLKVQVNSKASYQAVSERDVIDAVKPIETKYRVYSYPVQREIIESNVLTTKNEYGERNSLYMRLETTYRFVNMDKPEEFIDIKSYGDGIDTGDKATGKAMTYADKYALMKAYKISTGEDPDQEASKEYKKPKVTLAQIKLIQDLYTDEELEGMLKRKGLEAIEDLDVESASTMIKHRKGNK